MRHFDQDRAGKDLMHRCQWRRLYRNKGTFKRQFFLRTHPNPFMDEVGIEVVGQGNIDNRGVRLRTLGNDLGLEGFRIGTAFLWHGCPLNLGGNHRLKRWHQGGVLPGRLPPTSARCWCALPP